MTHALCVSNASFVLVWAQNTPDTQRRVNCHFKCKRSQDLWAMFVLIVEPCLYSSLRNVCIDLWDMFVLTFEPCLCLICQWLRHRFFLFSFKVLWDRGRNPTQWHRTPCPVTVEVPTPLSTSGDRDWYWLSPRHKSKGREEEGNSKGKPKLKFGLQFGSFLRDWNLTKIQVEIFTIQVFLERWIHLYNLSWSTPKQ